VAADGRGERVRRLLAHPRPSRPRTRAPGSARSRRPAVRPSTVHARAPAWHLLARSGS